jgi:hypothetical protein
MEFALTTPNMTNAVADWDLYTVADWAFSPLSPATSYG